MFRVIKRDVDMKNVEEPMSDESGVAANHVTKLPEVFSAHQSQQLAAARAYYNYLLMSNARDLQFAAAAHAQSQHRYLLNG